MTFRNSLVYAASCILFEGEITVEKSTMETKVLFSIPIGEGDMVFPEDDVNPSRYELPVVTRIQKKPWVFGIVRSVPSLLKMPPQSISNWPEILEKKYYRIAAVDFYDMNKYHYFAGLQCCNKEKESEMGRYWSKDELQKVWSEEK